MGEENNPSQPSCVCQCDTLLQAIIRGVAQSGRALALGARSRWFESSLPDQILPIRIRNQHPRLASAHCCRRVLRYNSKRSLGFTSRSQHTSAAAPKISNKIMLTISRYASNAGRFSSGFGRRKLIVLACPKPRLAKIRP